MKWLTVAATGCALITLAMLLAVLSIVDKEHFRSIVGTAFLGSILGAMILGGLLVLIGTWKLPLRKNWRGWVLFVWGAIALTSPLFGILFLLPWGVLALMLPLVIAILLTQSSELRRAALPDTATSRP